MNSDRGRERGHESKGNSEIRPPFPALDPSDRKELVVQRTLREHSSLDPSACTEEERPYVRALPHEFVGECQSRVEVAPGAASGENHDRTLMHGPPFPRNGYPFRQDGYPFRQDGASGSPERCS